MEPFTDSKTQAASEPGLVLITEESVLVAEDEAFSGRQLADFLGSRGFRVKTVANGKEAVTRAAESGAAIVVLDIRMPGELDGIEAARQIQQANPRVSVIFVTAYAKDPEYRQRVASANLRVAAWIEKPVFQERRELLVNTLRREGLKSRIRGAVSEAQARGLSSEDLPGLLEELRDELPARGVLDCDSGERTVDSASTRIDSLYAEIRSLAARSAADPSVRGQIDARRKELRQLQEQEAAELGRRYEASLGFKPGSLSELLERGRKAALGDA